MSEYRISLKSQKMGGHARALAISPRRRSQIARLAAQERWRREREAKANNSK